MATFHDADFRAPLGVAWVLSEAGLGQDGSQDPAPTEAGRRDPRGEGSSAKMGRRSSSATKFQDAERYLGISGVCGVADRLSDPTSSAPMLVWRRQSMREPSATASAAADPGSRSLRLQQDLQSRV